MSTWSARLSVGLLFLGTLAAGALHGRMTGRWGLRETDRRAAEQLLTELPPAAGNWVLRDESALTPDVLKVLQCSAHISRVYEHQQTGDVATVAVLLGPPGPISVHTPEICYSSRDFSISGERRAVKVASHGDLSHEFWELPLKTNNVHATSLRVLYAWNAGKQWEAAKYPRFGYGGLTHLYKLQVAVTNSGQVKSSDFDPGRDFLQVFLDQLQSRLIAARMTGALVE